MHSRPDRVSSVSVAYLLLGLIAGCSRPPDDPIAGAKPEPIATATADVVPPAAREAEAFEPPPLEQLQANATWIDRPVRDGLALLRAAQEKEPALATVAEALDLENDSAEANAKILSALGRLPAGDAADLADGRHARHRFVPHDQALASQPAGQGC
jgi:hypothetical protein